MIVLNCDNVKSTLSWFLWSRLGNWVNRHLTG